MIILNFWMKWYQPFLQKNRQKEGTTMRTLVVSIIILVTLFFVSLAGTADISLKELLQ
jgi:hypothetical protein